MLNTFQNSASVLSIGFFFTVITLGLATALPTPCYGGLTAQGVPAHGRPVDLPPVPDRQPLRRLPRDQSRSTSCSAPIC